MLLHIQSFASQNQISVKVGQIATLTSLVWVQSPLWWVLLLSFFLFILLYINLCYHLEDFKGKLLALIFFDGFGLEQLAIHIVELNQEILIEREHYLSEANLVDHHEWD